ncbi:MAG: hypothetical protein Devi2KO_27490 [Devosia indica]
MPTPTVSIIGLPASGKTTFLAALWHLMTGGPGNTSLRLKDLLSGNNEHLNSLAARWRDAKEQSRTEIGGSRLVSMNLQDAQGRDVQVTFPDVPGEAYRRMWEDRDCDDDVADVLRCSGVMLFVHSDTIKAPRWVIDDKALAEAMAAGLEPPEGGVEDDPLEWHPGLSPTQVQLVDLLQLLRRRPLDVGTRKIAIMLSAWDKAEEDGLSPAEFLKTRLPMLYQYLTYGPDGWDLSVYGISAQGGDYDTEEEDSAPREEAAKLRELDDPTERIRLVSPDSTSTDITVPISWLMS